MIIHELCVLLSFFFIKSLIKITLLIPPLILTLFALFDKKKIKIIFIFLIHFPSLLSIIKIS
jgi:hypothetical protein